MTDYLIAPPAEKVLPVTRGTDRAFTLRRVNADNEPVDYGSGTTVYMWIDVDPSAPTRVDATVTGPAAAFVIPSTVLDLCKSRTRWRIVLDAGEVETPLLVGRIERRDG